MLVLLAGGEWADISSFLESGASRKLAVLSIPQRKEREREKKEV